MVKVSRWFSGMVVGTISVLLAALLVAPSASADVFLDWTLDRRPMGMPAVTEGARTLETARIESKSGVAGTSAYAVVTVALTLKETPDADTASDVHVTLGALRDDGYCAPRWTLTAPTLDPGPWGERSGRSITLEYQGVVDSEWSCGAVSLTETDEPAQVYDRLEGQQGTVAIGDTLASVDIVEVIAPRVVPGRWTMLKVRVENRAVTVLGVVVRGKGRGLSVRRGEVVGPFEQGERATVKVWVKLHRHEATRLVLLAHPRAWAAFTDPGFATVRIRPRR